VVRWLVAGSLRFRGLIVGIAAATMFFGIAQLRDSPVDALPEFTPTTVEIQAEALGLSAAEVEQLVTVPFEQDLLNGVAFLDEIRSESAPGLSSIELTFEPGTDLFRARQVVTERLAEAQVALPGVSKPPQMLQPLSSTNRLLMVGLQSEELSLIELSVLARWNIKPRLLSVPGVANVAVWGFRDRQIQVQVDPARLRQRDVSLEQIVETSANSLWASPLSFVEASVPGTGGFIDTPNQRLGVMHVSPIVTADDLAQVRVEDTPYRLGDVANVVEDHQPLIGDANGGTGLVLVVEKFPEANALDVTRGVEEAIDLMRPGLTGIEFTTIYRPASFIEESIDNLTLAAIVGAVLLVLLLGAFFFEWPAVLVALIGVPLSLVTAGLVLHALGETVNAMVVAGFVAALGLVVFDAVGDVETFARRLREKPEDKKPRSVADTILAASLELRGAAAYATLIVSLALLPVFVVEGLAGEFLPPLAIAYLLAAAAAMLVALTVTPALSLLLLPRARVRREPPLARLLRRGYERLLADVLRRPRRTLLPIGMVVVAGLAAVPFLEPSLSPTFKERDLLVHLDGAPGTSLPEMNRITTQASRELAAIPGVSNVGAQVGRAVTSDQVVNVNSAELWVRLDASADYGATVAAVRGVIDGYPGLARDVMTFTEERVEDVLAGSDDDLTVRIYGEDLAVLRDKAEDVRQLLAGTEGVVAPRAKFPEEEPTVEVEVDLAAAERYGVRPGDVRRTAATLLSGIEVGSLFEEQKVFNVVVWGTPETRANLTSIRNLLIDTPRVGRVTLDDVADVRIRPNPTVIRHEAVSRYLDVAADVRGRRLGDVASDVKRGLEGLTFPLEYHAEVLDPRGTTQLDRLIGVGLAAAIGVLLLFQVALGSWRLALLAFAALPLALAGGALGALADGGAVSLGSLIGFVAVLAIFTRNLILSISRFRQVAARSDDGFEPALVVGAAGERLAATAATTLAFAAVLSPLAALGDLPGYELVHPLATVALGGLLTATLIGLFVVPVAFARFGSPGAPEAAPLAPARLVDALRRRAQARLRAGAPPSETPTGSESGS
jgi:Cu/Ag efflux pump CusA